MYTFWFILFYFPRPGWHKITRVSISQVPIYKHGVMHAIEISIYLQSQNIRLVTQKNSMRHPPHGNFGHTHLLYVNTNLIGHLSQSSPGQKVF